MKERGEGGEGEEGAEKDEEAGQRRVRDLIFSLQSEAAEQRSSRLGRWKVVWTTASGSTPKCSAICVPRISVEKRQNGRRDQHEGGGEKADATRENKRQMTARHGRRERKRGQGEQTEEKRE